MTPELKDATLLVHDDLDSSRAIVPPLYQNSLFAFDTLEEMEALFAGEREGYVYSRVGNPTVTQLQERLAALERGEAARVFSSGMAAISSAVISRLKAGDRVLCVRGAYPDAYKLFTRFLDRYGVSVTFVDGGDLRALEEALAGSVLLYLESPTSWTFRVLDLERITERAKAQGVFTIIDNSWATPLGQKPLLHGVDMVVHSASKYIGGHSDVVAGVVVGSHEAIARLNDLEIPLLGGKLAPFEAWLLTRGLRTLSLRLKHQGKVALELAKALQAHPRVRRVHHPLLSEDKGLAERYIVQPSGLFSIDLDASDDEIRAFVNALSLFRIGVSWGGHESLVCPALVGYAGVQPNAYSAFEVPRTLVRLSVGLEDAADLLTDLHTALGVIAAKQ